MAARCGNLTLRKVNGGLRSAGLESESAEVERRVRLGCVEAHRSRRDRDPEQVDEVVGVHPDPRGAARQVEAEGHGLGGPEPLWQLEDRLVLERFGAVS